MWVANYGGNDVYVYGLNNLGGYTVCSTGANPNGMAWDGVGMWITNKAAGNVSIIRPDSPVIDYVTAEIPVGNVPIGIAFDGSNMWVANNYDNNVQVIRVSDLSTIATYTTGNSPFGVAFDGNYMWVTNSGSNVVNIIRASDGYTTTKAVGYNPIDLALMVLKCGLQMLMMIQSV